MFTNIKSLTNNKKQVIQGFVDSIRNKSKICFLRVKDVTGSIQVTFLKEKNKKFNNLLDELTPQSVVTITGKKIINKTVKLGGCEFIPNDIVVESLAATPLPLDDTSLIDQRINYRWIDLRSEKNQLIFKLQTQITNICREWCMKQNFIEIHSPELIGAASESGSEVFEVSNYFGKKAYLAQSPQFYKQMAIAGGLEKVLVIGPVFRAEKSLTRKHATEFTGFDLEFAGVNSRYDVMIKEEEMMTNLLQKIIPMFAKDLSRIYGESYKKQMREDFEIILNRHKNEKLAKDIKWLLSVSNVDNKLSINKAAVKANNKKCGYPGSFPVMPLKEIYKELKAEYNYSVSKEEEGDINAEGEKLVYLLAMKKFNSEFMFIDGYDAVHRPFYHARDSKGEPDGFDLIWRGTEITSGAHREHRYEVLKKQAHEKGLGKDVEFYLQFFKYGCPPHGGFGIGLDRVTMLFLAISIGEAQFVFRNPNRLTP